VGFTVLLTIDTRQTCRNASATVTGRFENPRRPNGILDAGTLLTVRELMQLPGCACAEESGLPLVALAALLF
jgi:hypothetical protein